MSGVRADPVAHPSPPWQPKTTFRPPRPYPTSPRRTPPTGLPSRAPADPAPDLAALLTRAETEAADLKDAWLRAKAETDNVRKQATNDLARASKFAVERFAGDLLAVRDSLEQTTSRWRRRAVPTRSSPASSSR